MKKLSFILCIILMLSVFVGCSGDSDDVNEIQGEQLVTEFEKVSGLSFSKAGKSDPKNMPFIYSDLTMFENTTVNTVELYVYDQQFSPDQVYTFNINLIDSASVVPGGDYSSKKTYTLEVKGSEIVGGAWNTFDVSELGIKVGLGETLGFGDENSTLTLGYFIGKKSSALCYLDRNNAALGKLRLRDNNNMLVGVKGVRTEDPQLRELKEKLQGKYLSVFGASMCTYIGYSNDATTNTTIGNNVLYYKGNNGDVDSVDDTFWMQVVNQFDMKLLVNNSSSGSRVMVDVKDIEAAYIDRCRQLHADAGENAGKKPDVIVSFMGNNDYTRNYDLGTVDDALFATLQSNIDNDDWRGTTFAECYGMMVARMRAEYPESEIFLFNMVTNGKQSLEKAETYNAVINAIAKHYDSYIVDLTHSIMSGASYQQYSIDDLHPNVIGMHIWTDLVIDAMKKCYLSE